MLILDRIHPLYKLYYRFNHNNDILILIRIKDYIKCKRILYTKSYCDIVELLLGNTTDVLIWNKLLFIKILYFLSPYLFQNIIKYVFQRFDMRETYRRKLKYIFKEYIRMLFILK